MAHNIGQMFYYGKRPWHDLGEWLEKPANLEEALKAGGLDWEVAFADIALKDDPKQSIPQRRALVRQDRKPGDADRVVGVVHPDFVPLQNRTGAEMFDRLMGRGERVYHTGGYLKNGEVIWLMARLPEDILLNGEDVVRPYLLFTNSHDGSVGINIRLTTIRVVCNNTLSMALNEKCAHVFRRAHRHSTASLQQQAGEFLQFTSKQIQETTALFNRLATEPCDDAAFAQFLNQLMPDPKQPAKQPDIANTMARKAWVTRCQNLQQDRARILQIRNQGIPQQSIPGDEKTWWGAVNAITAWVDHVQEIKGSRYANNLFGAGDKLKTRALIKAQETVQVK